MTKHQKMRDNQLSNYVEKEIFRIDRKDEKDSSDARSLRNLNQKSGILLKRRVFSKTCTGGTKVMSQTMQRQQYYYREEEHQDNKACAICLFEFENADLVFNLPCGHNYHACCLNHWIEKRRDCRMCHFDIYKYFHL